MLKFPKNTSVPQSKADKRKAKDAQWRAVRKQVLERDGRRCRVCHRREGVDVHHIRFRSRGGADTSENLAAICRICHEDVHGYRLVISGNANGKLNAERTA